MSRRETAMELIHSNRCMINSCLAKDELKQFNGDFAEYIIRQLSILRNQDKKAEEAKRSASMLKMPCSETSVSDTFVDIIKVCADNKGCNIFLHDFCKTNEETIESVSRRPPHRVKFTDGSVLLVMSNSTYEQWCKGRTYRILGHGKQLYHSGYAISGGNDDSKER